MLILALPACLSGCAFDHWALQCRLGKLHNWAETFQSVGTSERVADSLHLCCCPAEANYAHQQELDMIPLLLQEGCE